MLNILIAKTDSSRDIISKILDFEECGVTKLRAVEDFAKIQFRNICDIDFVIADTEVLLKDDALRLNQLKEKGLMSRLILLGQEKSCTKLSYIICNGIKAYEPDIKNAGETIQKLLKDKLYEKEQELAMCLTLHDGSSLKKIKQALEKGDTRLLHKLVVSTGKMLPLPLSLVKEYISQILQTVFEFAEEKGVRHLDRKEILIEMLSLSDYESVRDYSLKKITGIVHLVEVNKKKHNNLVAEYIKDFIDENYMKQDTNAGNIADKFGVSSSYIGTLFREKEKTTITKYITQLRIAKAAELLVETKLQIQTISKKVGYSDQNYFARIFKKQTGLSPGEYRSNGSH